MLKIPYENLQKVNAPFQDAFSEVFCEVMGSGWYILGKHVETFEQEFAQYCGVKYCVGVASGLDAITLSLMALELPKNGEVILPANTCIPTLLAVVQAGLKPVLAEPNPNTYNIEANEIAKYISSKTVAVLPVHLYGKPCQMSEIVKLCQLHSLKLIEDCAQAHGASLGNQKVGVFGDLGAFSFYPTKNLGALGDGGAIITNDSTLAKKLTTLRNYGSEKKYFNSSIGLNSRLDELQAAFLRIKLQSLETINQKKRELALIYFQQLSGNVILPAQEVNTNDVFHIFPVRCEQRDELRAYLDSRNIGTEIHYPVPLHWQKGYKHLFTGLTFPLSEEISKTVLSLPISFGNTSEEISLVANTVNQFFKG